MFSVARSRVFSRFFLKSKTLGLYGRELYFEELMMFIITNHCTIRSKILAHV